MQKALGKLMAFLETWNNSGAYYGPVIHRLNAARLFRIHETEWTQSAMLEGYLNLYEQSRNAEYLEKAISIAKNDMSKYSFRTHRYRYAGHEDDRFCSLIHCSMINCALLRLREFVDKHLSKRILDVVEDNIDRYIIEKLWRPDYGAFVFSEKDYYSASERFVINMNAMALLMFLMHGSERYRTYIARTLDFILGTSLHGTDPLAEGATPYQRTRKEPDTLDTVSIYSGITLSAMSRCHKYGLSRKGDVAKFCRRLYVHLTKFRDPDTGLFYHTFKECLKRYPQFIAGSSFVLKGLDDYERIFGERKRSREIFSGIASYQQANGSFSGFHFYNSRENKRSGGRYEVIEDIFPTLSFNAHMFEYLTRNVSPDEVHYESLHISRGGFSIHDMRDILFAYSLYPIRSFAILLYWKRCRYAIIDISFHSCKNLFLKVLWK